MKMFSLLRLIKKNFVILARSKTSSLVIIFGPLLLILVLGLAFNNTNPYKINLGVYSDEYNDVSNSIIETLELEKINILKFESTETCTEAIREGEIHACVVFSGNLDLDNEEKNKINYVVDPTNFMTVDRIKGIIETGIQNKSQQVSTELTTVLLQTLSSASSTIDQQNNNLNVVIQSNDQTKTKLSANINSLTNLNTEMIDAGDFQLTNLRNQALNIKNKAFQAIDEGLDIIDDIDDAINDIENISNDEEEEIEDMLNDSAEDLINIRNQINITGDTSLENLVDNIDSQLNELTSALTTKLSDISSTKLNVIEELNTISETLSSNINELNAIIDNLNSLKEGIDTIEIKDVGKIVRPYESTVTEIVSDQTYLRQQFPSIIVLVMMFIGLLLSTSLVMMEKKNMAKFRNFLVPTRNITFVFAIYFTALLIMAIQIIIIILISYYLFNLDLISNLANVALVMFVLTTLFILLGMVVGYFFKSEETAIIGSISVGAIMLLLSNLIIPIVSMPAEIRNFVVNYNPFVIGSDMLKKMIVIDTTYDVGRLESKIILLVLYALILFALIMIFQQFSRSNVVGKLITRRAIFVRRRKKKLNDQSLLNKDIEEKKKNKLIARQEELEKKKVEDQKKKEIILKEKEAKRNEIIKKKEEMKIKQMEEKKKQEELRKKQEQKNQKK
ncbi:ABC transporter permease [Nanoarchaeota archaeon]